MGDFKREKLRAISAFIMEMMSYFVDIPRHEAV